ncbi:transcriptional regulator [Devosia yakushimensis]|uniref:Transcriptional regulator n=1 Tax=Devosia yakushimensis TaxID=470028 RepID=A0ABQ5UHN3_9HYPH|nr:MarR family transcriptional regulator [Devosia yakushimensis]GLQ10971.1 transcriptional regulator [Devosia yakushimensis]
MPSNPNLLRIVGRVARELSTGFDAQLKSLGLTSARARVLLLLVRSPEGVSQAAVTEFLGVEHPTAVRILDGLEGLGHIRREPAPHDRRAKLIVLTKAGRPLAEEVGVLTDRLNAQLMEGLSASDLATTNRILAVLLDRILALKPLNDDETEGESAP